MSDPIQRSPDGDHAVPLLPDSVPVTLPDLPPRLLVTTPAQFKALADPLRSRMLDLMRHHPLTAKQLADHLQVSPGAIGHHLRVLDEAGLIQLVARRLVRGIVAKYYTRSARIYSYAFGPQHQGAAPTSLRFLQQAHEHLAEALEDNVEHEIALTSGFPRARISPARADEYAQRLGALINEFVAEPDDPHGQVYAVSYVVFREPRALQIVDSEPV